MSRVHPTHRGTIGLDYPGAHAAGDPVIFSGTGVPSGGVLPTGQSLGATQPAEYHRRDPAGSDSCVYVTHNGGTTWTALTNTAFDPQDTEALSFGTGDDISIAWDGTRLNVTQATANSEIRWGVDGAGIDQTWYGDTASGYMRWDQSADSLILTDSYKLVFGTGSDVSATFDGSNLVIATAVADTGAVEFGADDAGVDVVLYGDTAGSKITWDQSADSLLITDSTPLSFGDSGDVLVQFDATNLAITTAVADTGAVALGVDGAGVDLILFGDTASAAATWDQSADSLILSGVAKIKTQTIADPGDAAAIPVTNSGSLAITTAAPETNSLPDPTFMGQWLSIFVDTYAVGDRVITAASRINQAGNTIITLGAAGDFIKLEAITIGGALKWQVVANDGAALS